VKVCATLGIEKKSEKKEWKEGRKRGKEEMKEGKKKEGKDGRKKGYAVHLQHNVWYKKHE
jgi:hypothetical protein